VGTNVVVSALEPYNLDVAVAVSGNNTVIPSNVLPFSVVVSPTSSYNTVAVPSTQGTPQFEVVTGAEVNASTASLAYQAYTASYLTGFVTSASYAATASVLYGNIESASFATFAISSSIAGAVSWSNVVNTPATYSRAISSSYALTASYASNVPSLAWNNITGVPVGLVSSSVQINTGSFSGSITTASYAQTASFVATASYAHTAAVSLDNKDIDLPVCNNQPANTVIKSISGQLNEPDSSDRFQFDLSTYSQYRVTSQVIRAGPSGSKLGIQYSVDQSVWNYLDITSGSLLDISTTGIRTTNWFTLDVSSRTDVFIRWVAVNGDDLSDTSFRYISLGVR
jgi:hypothetical protein